MGLVHLFAVGDDGSLPDEDTFVIPEAMDPAYQVEGLVPDNRVEVRVLFGALLNALAAGRGVHAGMPSGADRPRRPGAGAAL